MPRTVEPSMNVTVPVGGGSPAVAAVTVAVNVIDWPYTEGFGADLRVVVVVAEAAR